MDVTIKVTEDVEKIPIELLLLADPSIEMINEYLQEGIKIIAERSFEIVGVLVMLRTRPKTMEIMNVSVSNEYQNKGIGRQLILRAIEKAIKEGMKTLEIGTGNPGVIQLALYQKCGFRIVGIDFGYFKKHYKETIIENGIECRDMIRLRMDL